MAEIVQEKSRGLKFAEQQLLRHGWEQGKGLGRKEDGISEAIKVRVKCDKGGVGHKEGEQFTYHWWDHVFNKASSSLQVESDQNGVKVRKTVEEDEEGMISNKKPTKATLAKAKLYGCFVKSATLLSGQEQPEPKSSQSDDSSSSDDEDQNLDLSSTTKLSDADLMKVCGGRTAHKGARHGLTMSAKLARLEQQEAEFMAKYGKKSQSASPVCVPPTPQSAAQSPERQETTTEATQSKKMKKKSGDICENGLNGDAVSESPDMDTGTKKKKKKKKEISHEASEGITVGFPTEQLSPVENDGPDHSQLTRRKHKRREKIADENREEREATAEDKSSQGTAEASSKQQTDTKRKKKKTKHHREPAEEEEGNDAASSQSELIQKEKDAVIMGEAEVAESIVKQKRKKCKENKRSGGDDEALPPPLKKKKKKSKH